MLQHNFLPFEAKEIMYIPLTSFPLEDVCTWSYHKCGEYTVKTGLTLLRSTRVYKMGLLGRLQGLDYGRKYGG